MNIKEKSLKSLEYDKIKENLSNFAKTYQSKLLCQNIEPFDDIVRINRELQYTREAKFILDIPSELPIDFVANISEIKNNLGASFLSEEELVDVAKTLRTSRLVKNFLSNNLDENSLLKQDAQNLLSDKDLEDKIFDTFDDNLNVRQDATPELKGLFSALKDNEKNLLEIDNIKKEREELKKQVSELNETINNLKNRNSKMEF